MNNALKNSGRLSNTEALSSSKSLISDDLQRINEKARVSTADIESAVALIEQSFAIQQERIQIVADAAVLAVEQVQDKRLEMSEKGKSVTIEDVIFDMLTLYLWEVGLIGHVLQPLVKEVTQAICTRSLRYSAVYNQLSKSDYGAQFIGYARQEENGKQLLKEIIAAHVGNAKQFKSEEFAIFSQEARQLIANAPDLVWKKATGEVAKWKDLKKKVKETKLEMTDTPGVSMLKAAQSYVSSHRFALKLQQAKIVSLIRSQPTMTVKELKDLTSFFAIEELPETTFIRDQYQWTFEMIIWARLYGFTKDPATSPKIPTDSNDGFTGIRKELTDYWLARFHEVLVSYMRGYMQYYDQFTYVGKVTTLRNYFNLIMKQMEEKSKVAGTIEAAFQVTKSDN
ncbi:hypothetical protein [Cohnella candidum]|uniref:Uncharacterized protein n=1 Tax=Cohnella candidum TaxID=2674991 RepID=A0A3G3JW10_9BACL|nr:hypothetical protein [Cohnella candidum]AYQ72374.1 hypothetical protein EAV92_07180 [Cohnella candidum]